MLLTSVLYREAEGEVWVSCKIPGKPTIRGSLTSKGISSDEVPEVTASEEFVVQEVTKNRIPVSCPGENISCTFLSPYASFSHIHEKNVSYLDISSGGDLGVSSSTDQTFKVWETHNTEVKSVLEGHTRDVFSCKFFPSGQEVLSGGLDSLVKVWSVNDGSCLATMKGHRGSILDIAVVANGQNVISSGQDGTARLWDSAQGACIAVVDDSYSPINAIAVAEVGNAVNLGSPKETPSGAPDSPAALDRFTLASWPFRFCTKLQSSYSPLILPCSGYKDTTSGQHLHRSGPQGHYHYN
ncbi:proteasomal ATPase-associated factor 1-like isoform X2 [Xenopus tropicalis]|uniref:Proteasomal ATPase-associated factor 1-like isoform X2 n=1 Tax=Xenopus tropicalis TaxID=8364 RepID=A0A8J1J2V4_XENTR|nr:proteasomal ATPase-associated factor 1-like isoform X2 [Xenopus tropicalis]